MAENQYKLGIDGYQDNYKEHIVGLSEHARFGGFTADYIHSSNGYFTSVQSRMAYGKDNYKSVSGIINGIPQYEGELRLITGVSIPIPDIGGVQAIVPYFGIGGRYFYDNSKNQITNTGFFGYDRRIMQAYLPIGANWEFTHGGITFWPNMEFDTLIYGRVNSRLRNFDPTENNITNTQKKGYGARGELMVGQKRDGYSWQVGPYFRYWDIKDSNLKFDAGGSTPGFLVEPANTRLQTGAAFRVLF